MDLTEYERTGLALYSAFAEAVSTILTAAIATDGSIRIQQVQHRAKAPLSLRRKLEAAGSNPDTNVEEVAKDLAGCRLVLYSNNDVSRLNNARILHQNFEIIWARTKLHFPRSDEPRNTSQFIGDNYVVRLKADRAALVEYSAFSGLLCEVQVQTILNHAWSETAHDTIYKRPNLNGIGRSQLASIDARMKSIQEKYLLPAGYEFQQVLSDFERLLTGQRLLDADILTAICEAQNNNDRVELLDQYESQVLDLLDDPASVAPSLRAALTVCAHKAFGSPIEPIETPIGTLPGRTADDVVEKAIEILSRIRNVKPEEAFDTLAQFYCDAPDDSIRKQVRAAVGELAKYSLSIWRSAGPAVQEILLDAIAGMAPERLLAIRPLIIEVAEQCLAPEVTGASSTSSTFTWQTGAVVISARLGTVRDRALHMLTELFRSSNSDNERRMIWSAMKQATRLPYQAHYGDALLVRMLQDTISLVSFLDEQISVLSPDLAETIEEDLYFLYRMARDLPAAMLNNSDVISERDTLSAAILSFRDRLNAVSEYVIFKTLVGFETVFLYEWDLPSDAVDRNAKDHYREERIAEFVSQVGQANADEWFERLNRYAAIESDDLATFQHLGGFIENLATANWEIAKSWLKHLPGLPLERFRPGLLRGLYASNRAEAELYLTRAIEEGDDLSSLMHFLCFAESLDPSMFERAFRRSIELQNQSAVWKGLETAVKRPEDLGIPLARQVLLEATEELDRIGNFRWTNPLWLWGERSGLLAALTSEDVSKLLELIERLPDIDYHAEEILEALARRSPEQVIDVFGRRLARERATNQDVHIARQYNAIPFDFHHLHTVMGGAVDAAVDAALEWSREEDTVISLESARFVAILFPNAPQDLLNKLSSFVQSGDEGRQAFAVAVLRNYKGSPFVHSVLKDLVAVLPANDSQLSDVRVALAERGVMHGEFGYRDALIDQRNAVEAWLTDDRQPVRVFAEDLLRSIDNEIAAAERSAREDIAMRRLEYGEPLDTPSNPPEER
jgi:ppGpp synthetase/RelA/SpoT-type nucleotidyltranferase